ncbi:patatin-like phospholipase family protein [Streptomyces sp. NPDC052301]|uniref:patatin-like phospholipase family protein n=1 Tax=Streptomyces sp. NPDC052301 TaxID=3365687 RepID=UPI0037D49E01
MSQKRGLRAVRARPQRRRTGLVLSGGGFRGAYQTGFLKAAEEFGFQPDVVSGTSVGTLNAFLLRYLTPSQLVAYWQEKVTFGHFYQPYPVGTVVRLVCWFLLAPWIPLYWMFGTLRFGGAQGQLLTDTETAISTKQRNPWTLTAHGCIVFIPVLTTGAACSFFAGDFGVSTESGEFGYGLVLFALGSAVVVTMAPRIARRAESSGFTLFRSLLDVRLEEVVPPGSKPRAGAPRVFATVSVAERIFDYSNIEYYPPPGRQLTGLERVTSVLRGDIEPVVRPTLMPHYVHIKERSDSLAIAAASAALPLGMLPGRLHDGRLFRDGGSADNIPVFPLLDQGLHEILILDIAKNRWDREAFLSGLKGACRRQLLRAVSAEAMTIATDRVEERRGLRGARTVAKITNELDGRFGLKTPRVPEIHHVRLCEKRIGLTTVWASRRRIQAMQEHGYQAGRAFFAARRDAGTV